MIRDLYPNTTIIFSNVLLMFGLHIVVHVRVYARQDVRWSIEEIAQNFLRLWEGHRDGRRGQPAVYRLLRTRSRSNL